MVDLADDSTTVSEDPALFKGYITQTALSAHDCPIEDDTTQILIIPASTAKNTLFEFDEPLRFETSLVVDPDNAATGTITVMYRKLGALE